MPQRFTDIYIKSLKPQTQRYDVREADGFGMRVFPSGEKSWTYTYTFLGRKRRMTLGKYESMPLREARQTHADARKVLASGLDPAEHLKATREAQAKAAIAELKSPTVAALVQEYLERWAKVHKRTWEEDERILTKDVVPPWGKRKAKDIERRDVVLLLDSIKSRGAPIQANRTLAVVRRMFNFAVERGILDTTPTSHIKAPAKENRRDRVLTPDEIKRFWYGLDSAPLSLPTRLALRLILVTGQRKSEVLNMAWSEIDTASGWWTIPAEKTKNGEQHRVPLSDLALSILDELREISISDTWVFPSPRTVNNCPMTATALDHAVRRCTFEEVAHFTPHDLRRTVGTCLGELGFNRLVQDKVLNHKDNTVGGIYDRHSYDKEKRQALETWADYLQTMLTGKARPVNVLPMARAT